MIFDRYITVDWSASNSPKSGKDSIWVCSLGADGEPHTANPRTRGSAETMIRDLLVEAVVRQERVLIGFDFPYAYPRGFAESLGLDGASWRAVWEYLCEHLIDDAKTNQSNRFAVASEINRRLAEHAFWGRPSKQIHEHLSMKRERVVYRIEGVDVGLSEWREVELLLRRRKSYPQPTWKLLGAGSVGSQALTGIPIVSRLRFDSDLEALSRVWPFELIGPERPEGQPAIIHAEIWPSLIDVPTVAGQVKDQSQVIRLAAEFRARDQAGSLGSLFAAGASANGREEGWILGVTPEGS